MGLISFSISVFTGLIAMINPIANIPVFLGLVNSYPQEKKSHLACKACVVAFVILVFFILLGKFIFSIFGITIPAFKITGGILIFKIGFDMLSSKRSPEKHMEHKGEPDDSIAISPLAIPLLAGPGAIVTAMDSISDTTFIHLLIVVVISALVLFINYISLRSGDVISKRLGHNVIEVLNKLMGLILAIMGTGMIISGLQLLLPKVFAN